MIVLARLLAELPQPDRSPDGVTDAVHGVLSRPEYRYGGKPLLTRIWDSVADWVARVLSSVVGAGIVAWLVVAAVLGLVAFVAWRLARDVSRDPGRGVSVHTVRVRPAADWRAEAEVHERAGEWRQALRCRYRALVAELASRGFLDEIPGRTAGEYRAELGASLPSAAPPFRGVTDLFEGAWYGRRPTTQDDAARFRELEERVLAAAS